jgi:hypothetical protein
MDRRRLTLVNYEIVFEERSFESDSDRSIELWLEPSGMMFLLAPGRRLDVLCQGPAGGQLEIEHHQDGHMAVYSWAGARLSVLESGRAIYAESPEPLFPSLPRSSIRETVELIFGSFEERRRLRRAPKNGV